MNRLFLNLPNIVFIKIYFLEHTDILVLNLRYFLKNTYLVISYDPHIVTEITAIIFLVLNCHLPQNTTSIRTFVDGKTNQKST